MEDREKVIDKLRKLLAMAADAGSPNEAAIAARMAEKLMRQHNIDNADEILRELQSGKSAGLAERDVFVSWLKGAGHPTRHTPPWSHPLAAVLQGLFDVRVLHVQRYHAGKVRQAWRFVGYSVDVEAAAWTFEYLIDTAVRLSKRYADSAGVRYGHRMFHHYQRGVAMGMAYGVMQAVQAREAAQRNTTGTALVVAKHHAIDEHLAQQDIAGDKKGKLKDNKTAAFYAGVVDGRKINVNPKTLTQQKGEAK